MMKKPFFYFLIIVAFNCKNQEPKKLLSTIKVEQSEFNFGEITMTDSIVHTFYLKNVSTTPLKINEVGVSCGCTSSNYTQTEVSENGMASIEVVFKPDEEGVVDKSIVVETNTDPPFNVFYIKGNVK